MSDVLRKKHAVPIWVEGRLDPWVCLAQCWQPLHTTKL